MAIFLFILMEKLLLFVGILRRSGAKRLDKLSFTNDTAFLKLLLLSHLRGFHLFLRKLWYYINMIEKNPFRLPPNLTGDVIIKFTTQMNAAGWQLLYSTFDTNLRWRHVGTNKVVDHDPAFTFFWLSGNTPNPDV